MLFSTFERSETRSKAHLEPEYVYLDQSARPEAGLVRGVLEQWFAGYPDGAKEELKRRLTSSDDDSFLAAFFELYLHELMRRLGCSVRVHPDLATDSSKHPDFLAERPGDQSLYLEACLANELSKEQAAKIARMNAVYDAINRMHSPDYFIGMNLEGGPTTPPKARRLRSELTKWLEALDYDAVRKDYTECGLPGLPKKMYEHEGWSVEFSAIPKSEKVRGKLGVRPIGLQFHQMRWAVPKEAVRDAVATKATRYGTLGKPYVIALNFVGVHCDSDDVLQALLGSEQYLIDGVGPSAQVHAKRARDGAWFGPEGPQNTRVSAVLFTSNLNPWNVARRDVCLYHNPWAQRRCRCAITVLSEAQTEEGLDVVFKNGIHPRVLFGLPEGWPEGTTV